MSWPGDRITHAQASALRHKRASLLRASDPGLHRGGCKHLLAAASDRDSIGWVSKEATEWFAVRCIFAKGWPAEAEATFEERVTLWRANSLDEAIERAETEARAYASVIEDAPDTYLGLAQAYRLADEPSDGAEVFSLIRRSELGHDDYLDAFFATGFEYERDEADDDA